jgi:hypothetical protein
MTRRERIEDAVCKAGELIGALEEHGPITPEQTRILVHAVARAAVPNLEAWEVWQAATLISKELSDENLARGG